MNTRVGWTDVIENELSGALVNCYCDQISSTGWTNAIRREALVHWQDDMATSEEMIEAPAKLTVQKKASRLQIQKRLELEKHEGL
jgi:hypothetical protein